MQLSDYAEDAETGIAFQGTLKPSIGIVARKAEFERLWGEVEPDDHK